MGLNSFYANIISPWLRKTEFGERIDMAIIAFNANFQFAKFMYAESDSKILSEGEIEDIFSDLDTISIEVIKRFMKRQYKALPNSLMIHPKYFYSENENTEYRKLLKDFDKAVKHFKLPRHLVGPESLYYHHGLRFAPDFIKKNISGKLFGDVGGYLGDSTLVFSKYEPKKIIIFEPEKKLIAKLKKTLKNNQLKNENYDIHPIGLSDTSGLFNGMHCSTLDEIRSTYTTPFGVIKADIEGMGAAFLRGAIKTIKRDRPLLSLAIYHNEDELVGIYKMIKSWNLDYHIEIRSLNPHAPHGEITLIAYPKEWSLK